MEFQLPDLSKPLEQILELHEKAMNDLLGKLDPADRQKMAKVFDHLTKGKANAADTDPVEMMNKAHAEIHTILQREH